MKNIVNIQNEKTLRGLVIMIAGIGLLLHTLGIIQTGINLILILTSVAMIIYGFAVSDLQHTVRDFVNRYRTRKTNRPSTAVSTVHKPTKTNSNPTKRRTKRKASAE
jgi:uncharacterized membrane protein